jgi:protein O-GlcNAc transferase
VLPPRGCVETGIRARVVSIPIYHIPLTDCPYTTDIYFISNRNNLGVLCTVLGHAREALGALQAAICADPSYAVAHNNAGVLFRDTGDIPEALASYKECARLNPDDRNASQNYLMSLNYVYDGRLPLVSDAHIQWGQRMMQSVGLPMRQRAFDAHRDVGAGEKLGNISQLLPLIRSNSRGGNPGRDTPPIALTPGNSWDDLAALTSRGKINPTQNSRPLVVGYVSPDMYTHSVSYFAAAPLAHHDRTRVKCVVYSATPVEDSRTKLLRAHVARAGGEWRDVSLLTERALAELIHSDGVDILVELSGHTANNKLATLALRPAPVQVTWAGYPNTTGLNGAVDYRITDEYCDPVDTRQVFAETNVRLPGCFLSYAPHPASPPVAPAPCVNAGYVTFGCFNALAKITKNVRALWGRLLKQTPNSRLVVKAKPFACVSIRDRFLAAMATEQGIASWRIDVRPLVASTETHLRTYAQIDIALDTFPYAGTTTTCEALFAGVPVVTLAGHSHAHNVGVSLLAAVDLEGRCVAKSENEYVAMCVALASDHSALGELRKGMRATMQKRNGLCDGAAFTTKLEHAYVAMWRRYCAEKGRA